MSSLEKILFDLRKNIIKDSEIGKYLDKKFITINQTTTKVDTFPDTNIIFWNFIQRIPGGLARKWSRWIPEDRRDEGIQQNELEKNLSNGINKKIQLLVNKYKIYKSQKNYRDYPTWGLLRDIDYKLRGKLIKNLDLDENNKEENNITEMFLNQNQNIKAKLNSIQNLENEINEVLRKLPISGEIEENNKQGISKNKIIGNKLEQLSQMIQEEKQLEIEKIYKILNKRANNLKKCSNLLKSSNSSAETLEAEATKERMIPNQNKKTINVVSRFFEEQSIKEKLPEEVRQSTKTIETIQSIINKIKISNKNLNFNKEQIKTMLDVPPEWDEESFNKFKEILKLQENKVFLLGRSQEGLEYFKQYRDLFYVSSAYTSKNLDLSALNNKKERHSCRWTSKLNYFFLYMIKYSKIDFSGMIIIPNENKFPKKREKTSISNFIKNTNMIFLGFLMIPYTPLKTNETYEKNKKTKTRELFISVFINKENKKLFLYSLDLRIITLGQIFPDYTVLYDEIKSLFGYLNKLKLNSINAYYNESIPKVIFLSTKSEKYINDTYKDSEKYGIFKILNYEYTSNKHIEFKLDNKILLQSMDYNKNLEYSSLEGGKNNSTNGVLFNLPISGEKYLNKIIFVSRIMLYQFNLYLIKKYSKKIIKKFNIDKESPVLYDFLFKNYSQTKLLRYNTDDFLVKNYFSREWKYSLEILYDDLTKFNKNISFCEISVSPSAFEILNNFNVDVYYTDKNFKYLASTEWHQLINNYKNKSPKNINFIYNKKKYLINKKYDIMILNLILDRKLLSKAYKKKINYTEITSNNYYVKYSVKTVIKYVKEQLVYLDYVKIGGNCYFKIHNLMTQEIINIYYKICELFENVEPYFIKYEDIYRERYGGCWLKCYNKLKTHQKIDKDLLFQKVEQFNYNIYNKMIQQFYEIERFIKEKLDNNNNNNNSKELDKQIFNIQLDTAINFCKEYNLKISPKWKKIIRER